MPTLTDDEHIAKIHFWNKLYRSFLLFLVLLMVGLVGFTAFQLNQNTKHIKDLINSNQRSTVEARKANTARQYDLQNYVKCLSLLKFDDPQLLTTSVTRQQVSDALDKCAKAQ